MPSKKTKRQYNIISLSASVTGLVGALPAIRMSRNRRASEVSADEWPAVQVQAGHEPIEHRIDDIRQSDFSTMPEEIHIHVLDDYFPAG